MSAQHPIHSVTFLSNDFAELAGFLSDANYDKFFILADENTMQHCMPLLVANIPSLGKAEVLEIESGEENKTLEIANPLWQSLSELEATRKSLFINLGGGVICDLGGFVASIYKRGIDFIHIPTSLLAQVDAALGGKTGIDFLGLKNQLGLFALPKNVFITPQFLDSLPNKHLLNGYAEMLKHGLIADRGYWQNLSALEMVDADSISVHIQRSVEIKMQVANQDFKETHLRKSLNFGHTFGHALESYSLAHDAVPLYHGEAVAMGMLVEAYLSHKKCGLSETGLVEINNIIKSHFALKLPQEQAFDELWQLMRHDKKNTGGQVNFALISDIGQVDLDVNCERDEVLEGLRQVSRLA